MINAPTREAIRAAELRVGLTLQERLGHELGGATAIRDIREAHFGLRSPKLELKIKRLGPAVRAMRSRWGAAT